MLKKKNSKKYCKLDFHETDFGYLVITLKIMDSDT